MTVDPVTIHRREGSGWMGGDAKQAPLREIESLAVGLADTARESLARVREARSELPPQCGVVAFVHIPKTAGGTVVNMLAQAYSRSALHDAGNYVVGPKKSSRKLTRRRGGWLEWERRGGRATAGHVPYAVYRRHLPQGTRYLTFLREPVDRVVSHYYQHIRQRQDGRDPRALNRGKVLTGSIEEAFELGLPMMCNLATRFLCGHASPMGKLPENALDDAKANLRDFAFVGLQERFEESILLLQRMLGLELTPYLNRHVSIGRPLVADLPEEERRLILAHNQLDAELYAFGKELFDRSVASAGDGFGADLDRLTALSREVNEAALQRAQELLDRELPIGTSKPKAELFAAARRSGVPAAALKHVTKVGVRKGGAKLPQAGKPSNAKAWTRTR